MALETPLPDGPLAEPLLRSYFPRRLQDAFAAQLGQHPLRREIVATVAVNHMLNNGGIGILARLTQVTGVGLGDALSRYLELDREGFAALRALLQGADRPAPERQRALLALEDRLEALTRAALAGRGEDPAAALAALRSELGL
jgi:glutamate dehydrogenase